MMISKSVKDYHDLYPYNVKMAEVLYRSMWLENLGSGAKRIIEACQKQGVEELTWRWDGAFVYVTFKRPLKDSSATPRENLGGSVAPNVAQSTGYIALSPQESKGESLSEAPSKGESIQEIASGKGEGIQEIPQSNGESIQEQGLTIRSIQESIQELKTNREKVLYILFQNPSINLEEVAKLIGLSRIGIQKIVGKLKSEGMLLREGSTKAGKWIVNTELKN